MPRRDSKCCRRPSSSTFLEWCWRSLLQLFDPRQHIPWRVRSNHRSVRGDLQGPNADAPRVLPACSPQTRSDALVCPLPQAWLPRICFTVMMGGAWGEPHIDPGSGASGSGAMRGCARAGDEVPPPSKLCRMCPKCLNTAFPTLLQRNFGPNLIIEFPLSRMRALYS